MLQSLQVSESGLLAQQRKLEVIANNLANATTPGFRRILSTFVQDEGAGGATQGVATAEDLSLRTRVDFSSGGLEATGNPLDLAIEGEGFFVVQTPTGERFTRNGSFTLDAQGRLSTREGWPVLTSAGEVRLPLERAFEIGPDGLISSQGAEIARLRLVRPEQGQDWTPAEGTTLRTIAGAPGPVEIPPESVRLRQGHLELSNVVAVSELIQMIQAQRIFEAGQKMLVVADETLRRAVNELPQVRG